MADDLKDHLLPLLDEIEQDVRFGDADEAIACLHQFREMLAAQLAERGAKIAELESGKQAFKTMLAQAESDLAAAQAELARCREAAIKEIAASALQTACESAPADPDHPDTILITTGDFETVVRCALENWIEARNG